MARTSWDQSVEVDVLDGWYPLDETGLDAAIGWSVPAGHLGRRPIDDTGRTVDGYEELPNGERAPFSRPFTTEDRESIEGHINWYLEEAGIPERPPGFEWFIRGPITTGYDSPVILIEDAVIKRGGSDPERIRDDLGSVIRATYPE